MPRVSVVIPAYNAERFIGDALDSVMAQTFRDVEVIVVDDGSTDGTGEIVRSYGEPVRLVDQANAGPSAARNRGVREAKSELVAFLDADDRWLPEKLALQVPLLDGNAGTDLVHCRVQLIDASGQPMPTPRLPAPSGRIFHDLLERNVLGTSAVVVRKARVEQVGGFPEDMKWAEDWLLWLRLAQHCQVGCVEEVLVQHREHGASLATEGESFYRGVLEVLARIERETDDARAIAIARRTRRRVQCARGLRLLREGCGAAARRPLLGALAGWPIDPRAAAGLALSFLPAFARGPLLAWRRARRGARQADAASDALKEQE